MTIPNITNYQDLPTVILFSVALIIILRRFQYVVTEFLQSLDKIAVRHEATEARNYKTLSELTTSLVENNVMTREILNHTSEILSHHQNHPHQSDGKYTSKKLKVN